MNSAVELTTPLIETRPSSTRYELLAALQLDQVGLPAEATWRVGISAIVEEVDGSKSYWALAHPEGKPDFHHADCFTLELVPA
jgi:hypothetical protein